MTVPAVGSTSAWYLTKVARSHEFRVFDYVGHPYPRVTEALRRDPADLFGRATEAAASRADAIASRLPLELGALEVGTDIAVEVAHAPAEAQAGSTLIQLRWKAARSHAIFPSMLAELTVYPLTHDETQLDLRGVYRPPPGVLGQLVDTVVGRRIAEASVHRFMTAVADALRGLLR